MPANSSPNKWLGFTALPLNLGQPLCLAYSQQNAVKSSTVGILKWGHKRWRSSYLVSWDIHFSQVQCKNPNTLILPSCEEGQVHPGATANNPAGGKPTTNVNNTGERRCFWRLPGAALKSHWATECSQLRPQETRSRDKSIWPVLISSLQTLWTR